MKLSSENHITSSYAQDERGMDCNPIDGVKFSVVGWLIYLHGFPVYLDKTIKAAEKFGCQANSFQEAARHIDQIESVLPSQVVMELFYGLANRTGSNTEI